MCAASIKTSIKIDDSEVKAKLDSISKHYKKTYNAWASETAVLNSKTKELNKSKEWLLKAEKSLNAEKEKGSKADQKRIARYEKNIAQTKKHITLLGKEKRLISSKMSAQKSEMAQMKTMQGVLNQNTVAKTKNAVATASLANQTIRYLRWAGTIAGVLYAVNRAYSVTLGLGIQVNKMMEDNVSGIAALLSANTQMVLTNGEVVNSYEKFQIGQKVATKTMDDLREASIKTYATFPQLTEIFQQAIGQTLSMGDAFGTTVDEINSNTIKLSQRMSNIAGAIGMPMDRAKEEIRSLLSGNASTDSLISTMIFGSPGEANKAIRMAKDRGESGLTDLLNSVLAPFDALESVDSYTRSLLELEDAWSQLWATASEPMFESLKVSFEWLADAINELNSSEIKIGTTDLSSTDIKGMDKKQLQSRQEDISEQLRDANKEMNSLRIAKQEYTAYEQYIALESEHHDKSAYEAKNKELVQLNAIEKQIRARLALLADEASKNDEKIERLSKEASLMKNFALNSKLIGIREKENNKSREKTVKLSEDVLINNKEIAKLGEAFMAKGMPEEKKKNFLESINILLDSNAIKEHEIAEIQLTKRQKEQKATLNLWVAQQNLLGVEVKKSDMIQHSIDANREQLAIARAGIETKEKETDIAKLLLSYNKAITDEKLKEIDKAYAAELDILDIQLELANSAQNWQNGLEGVAAAVGGVSNSFSKMHVNNLNYAKAQTKLDKQHEKDLVGVQEYTIGYYDIKDKHEKDSATLKAQNTQNEIAAYGNLAGAMAGMFEENSKEAKAALLAQQALAIANAVASMAAAASSGDPYTAPMRVAAMVGIMANVLQMGNIAFGGGGGSSAPTAADTAASYQEQVEVTNKPILDRLDRQIELLEALGGFGGTAVGAEVSLAGATYEKDLQSIDSDILGIMSSRSSASFKLIMDELEAGTGGWEDTIYAQLDEGLYSFISDYSQIHSNVGITADEWAVIESDMQQATHDYTMSLLEQVAALSSAADSFEDAYDTLTGTTFYEDLELEKAQAAVDDLLSATGMSLEDYLQAQIGNISTIENALDSADIALLLSDDIDDLAAQQTLLTGLSDELSAALAGGAEEALNNKDAILLVTEAMSESESAIISLVEASNLIADDIVSQWDEAQSRLISLSDTFTQLGESIEDTITTLLGGSDALDAQDTLIETFWKKQAELDPLLEKGGDLTEAEQATLTDLIGDVNQLSLSIQKSSIGDNALITSELVTELGLLGTELEASKADLSIQDTILGLTDTAVEYLGADSDIVAWLKTLNGTVADIGFSEYTTDLATAEAYAVVDGSHAEGLNYVPYDGYVAELHRGERVLTQAENNMYPSKSMIQNYATQSSDPIITNLLSQIVQRLDKIEATSKSTAENIDDVVIGSRSFNTEVSA